MPGGPALLLLLLPSALAARPRPQLADVSPRLGARPRDLATLAVVPAVWGTYAPLVKLVYQGEPSPPPLLFNALSFAVSLSFLAGTRTLSRPDKPSPLRVSAWRAGAELGSWLFLGSSLQLLGLQSTSSVKAAVLVQTTTVLVPLLESVSQRKLLPAPVYLSCAVAALGVLVLSGTAVSLSEPAFEKGDLLVLAAALFYSVHVLRLGALASDCDPVELALTKSCCELFFSLVAIWISVAAGSARDYTAFIAALSLGGGSELGPLLGALLWNGVAATALTTWAQSEGQVSFTVLRPHSRRQKRVPPSQANLVYSSQPLWSTLFAVLFLHETLDTRTSVGCAILMVAVFAGSLSQRSRVH